MISAMNRKFNNNKPLGRIYLAFLALLLCVTYTFSQNIPDENKWVLKYVDQHLGSKVDKGICFNLVDEALMNVTIDWKNRNAGLFKNEYVYGKKIKKSKLLPGDIILYSWSYNKHSSRISHVCIVYKIEKGQIYVAEQNTKGSLKKSIVEINLFEPGEYVYGMKFYRPY